MGLHPTSVGLPGVTLSVNNATIAEASGVATFTATLSATSVQDVTIDLGFSGTATLTDDYIPSGTQIVITAGNLTGSVTATAVPDALFELDETIVVNVLNVTNANPSGSQQEATTITGNAATADLSVAAHGNETGPVDIVYLVTLSQQNETGALITFDLDDLGTGTAAAGSDYTAVAANGKISVAPGTNTGTFTVAVTDDSDFEPDETLIAQISNSSNGTVTIGTAGATAVITDNDDTRVFLNEVLINPDGASDGPNEYIELRGPANQSLDGVYLIILQGGDNEDISVGKIFPNHIVNLSSVSIGSNGFLAIVDDTGPQAHTNLIAAGTTVVSVDGLDFQDPSYTLFLIHRDSSSFVPVPGFEFDPDGNGLDPLPTGWTILDGVSVIDNAGSGNDRGYADIVFSAAGTADIEPGATFINAGFDITQVMRIGDSTGSAAGDWVAFDHNGTAPSYTIAGSTNAAYPVGTFVTHHLGFSNPTGTPGLSVSIAQLSIAETGGSTIATVSRNSTTTGALTVNLSSDDTSEATVPASVTIPNGLSAVSFTITGVDDAIIDGTRPVTITATAAAHADGTDTVDVIDDDANRLTLVIATASISENGGAGIATVSRYSDMSAPLTVTLSSNDPGEASVPATVTIAAGRSTSDLFSISGVDDFILDGTQTATITASAAAHVQDMGTIDVTDDDTPAPALSLNIVAASLSENSGATTATVIRNTSTGSALLVTLTNSDAGEANIPTTVTIAAGQTTSAPFAISGVGDSSVDGTQRVLVTASAAAHADGTDSIDVTDDDVPTLTLTILGASVSENGGVTTATVSRNLGTDGLDVSSDGLTVNLASSDPGGSERSGDDQHRARSNRLGTIQHHRGRRRVAGRHADRHDHGNGCHVHRQ